MAKSNKSKWVIGLTGTALSAFVISQIGTGQANGGNTAKELKTNITKSMSTEEKEFVQLDWTSYEINRAGVTVTGGTGVTDTGGAVQSDRQTRRS